MVYELEGHTALRLRKGADDMTVHWGLFDFKTPNFVYRFVKGETDYSIGVIPTDYFLKEYARDGRKVTELQLNLTPVQADRLYGMIMENLRPENRVYRYNYVKDNCATRPLSVIEKALGTEIVFTDSIMSAPETFRGIMRRYHANYPWYQFGIDIALGSGIDYDLDVRATAFAPVILERLMKSAAVPDSSGAFVPLVSGSSELVAGDDCGTILGPTPFWLTPCAMALFLLLVSVAFTVRDIRRCKVTRWFDAILFALSGLAGCLVAFLVFVSVHEATSPNIHILWLNPLCLIVPVCIWLRGCARILRWYMAVNIIAVLTFLILWGCGFQSMGTAFLPLALCYVLRSVNYLIISRE